MTEKLLLLVGVTTLCMLSPGPDMFLVMRNTLTGGRWHGAMTAIGVLTGNLVHIGYCVFGVAVLLLRSQPAYNAIRMPVLFTWCFSVFKAFVSRQLLMPIGRARHARARRTGRDCGTTC